MSSSKLDNSMRNILKALKQDSSSNNCSNNNSSNNSTKPTLSSDDCTNFTKTKLKRSEKEIIAKEETSKLHETIKTHPLLTKLNKPTKEASAHTVDLFNKKSNNTIKNVQDAERSSKEINSILSIVKTCKNNSEMAGFNEFNESTRKESKKSSQKDHAIESNQNFFPTKNSTTKTSAYCRLEEELDTYEDETDQVQDLKMNDSNGSCINNNQNNNNQYYKQAPFKLNSQTDCSYPDNRQHPSHGETLHQFCPSEVKRKFQRANRVFYNGFLNKQDKTSTLPEYQAHAAELLHFLKSLWMTNTMCDLVFIVANRKYSAHRLGLAMFSHKYRDEFQRQLLNKNTGVYTICLKNTTCSALEAILKYIYTAKIDINPANVEEILDSAKELGIDDLICMTKDYLSSLSMGDLLDFMSNILNKEGFEFMFYELYSYMMTHLDKICRTPEYCKSSILVVKALLNDSHLAVFSELEVFEAAVRWINFDRSRQKYLVEIMKSVRFTQMTPDELVKVECHSQIVDIPEIQKMLYNAFKFHALNSSGSNLNKICQKEESRNFCLKGASVPDEFVKAIIELSEIAHRLKENRNYTTSNLINCDDDEDSECVQQVKCKPMKNVFNFNNNNNNNNKFDLSSKNSSFFQPKYEEIVKKISNDFNKMPKCETLKESDEESNCSRCKTYN